MINPLHAIIDVDTQTEYIIPLLGEKCVNHLFRAGHPWSFSSYCVKLLLSKAFSVIVITLCLFAKIPQITIVYKTKSAKGINLMTLLLETLCMSVGLAYNVRNEIPWLAFSELLFLLPQNIVLLTMVFYYTQRWTFAFLTLSCIPPAVFALLREDMVSPAILQVFLLVILPLSLAGPIPQIWQNYQRSSTGNISAVAIFIAFTCTMMRLFTAFLEVEDRMLVLASILGAILAFIPAVQMVLYWNSDYNESLRAKKRL